MLGIRFAKFPPTTFVIKYRGGKVVREGVGISFFYYAPASTLVAIPVGSIDAPFIFEEQTADYQAVSLQGQITFRVAEPKRLASMLDFTLAASGRGHASNDPEKLPQRIVSMVHVLARAELTRLPLRDALRASDPLAEAIRSRLVTLPELAALGVEILGLSFLAIKPTPETGRALEAETRERILREADEAVCARRNAAVEQERAIRENELNTEIAVEKKQRQIREAQMDAERAVQEKKAEMEAAQLASQIRLEEERKKLVALAAENARVEAEARAFGIAAAVKALADVEPRVFQALAASGMKPNQLIATAFQELASRADRIGQLNITPDLLGELLGRQDPRR